MRITAEMSLYPLTPDFVAHIRAFIERLHERPGLEVVTNAMSTQVRGEFDAVTGAIHACLREAARQDPTMVLVVKYLSADLEIGAPRSS